MPIKDRYYTYILGKSNPPIEEKIVFSLLRDIVDRRGLKQAWDQIDKKEQDKIINAWIDIVKLKLTESGELGSGDEVK
jgi:hypothetical protein